MLPNYYTELFYLTTEKYMWRYLHVIANIIPLAQISPSSEATVLENCYFFYFFLFTGKSMTQIKKSLKISPNNLMVLLAMLYNIISLQKN